MTFDLDPETTAAQARVRAIAAEVVAPAAAGADAAGRLSPTVLQRAGQSMPPVPDAPSWVVCLEELATASGAVAVQIAGDALSQAAAVPPAKATTPWAGLRGADVDRFRQGLGESAVWHLSVSAVLVGLGRAAIEATLASLREARAGGAKPEQEQWPVADAATALDAARLLLWRAATGLDGTPRYLQVALAMARLQALDGAQAAVAAARRALDVEASRPGTLVDRIARDVATAALVFGKADAHERAAAAGVLPD